MCKYTLLLRGSAASYGNYFYQNDIDYLLVLHEKVSIINFVYNYRGLPKISFKYDYELGGYEKVVSYLGDIIIGQSIDYETVLLDYKSFLNSIEYILWISIRKLCYAKTIDQEAHIISRLFNTLVVLNEIRVEKPNMRSCINLEYLRDLYYNTYEPSTKQIFNVIKSLNVQEIFSTLKFIHNYKLINDLIFNLKMTILYIGREKKNEMKMFIFKSYPYRLLSIPEYERDKYINIFLKWYCNFPFYFLINKNKYYDEQLINTNSK